MQRPTLGVQGTPSSVRCVRCLSVLWFALWSRAISRVPKRISIQIPFMQFSFVCQSCWTLPDPILTFSFVCVCCETVASWQHCIDYTHDQCWIVQTRCNTCSPGVWRTVSSLSKQGKWALLKLCHFGASCPTFWQSSDHQAACVSWQRKSIER